MLKGENKFSELDERKILNFFSRISNEEDIKNQPDTIIESCINYIFHTYTPESYENKQFIFQIPDEEYGLDIYSYKIIPNRGKHFILDGIQTHINAEVSEGIPFIFSSYTFYKNGTPVENFLKEKIYSNGTSYLINNEYVGSHSNTDDEPLYSVLKQINDKIKIYYPWLQELANANEDVYKLLIIDEEKVDKVKFVV